MLSMYRLIEKENLTHTFVKVYIVCEKSKKLHNFITYYIFIEFIHEKVFTYICIGQIKFYNFFFCKIVKNLVYR